MEKLILHHRLAPGDDVMLTAAVRDLHATYPNRYLTDVRTPSADIWKHNPHITTLQDDDPEARHVTCEYPLIHRSNQSGCHFVYGYMEHLARELGLEIKPTAVKGDIHLAKEECDRSEFLRSFGLDGKRYWLIAAGGKYDFTIKWWSHPRFQEVVDQLQDEIHFVQIGRTQHEYHPKLNGVTDLRNRTSLRELIGLVHHADGVLSPVTLLMHLAAAVPMPEGGRRSRPAVVIAGGREPMHWEAYPHHQYVHTIGTLDCCATGGCWRSRTVPLGDGHKLDGPGELCLNVVKPGLARCMDMITAEDVVRRLRLYLTDEARPPQLTKCA